MIKKLLLGLLTLLTILIVVLLVNTFTFTSKQITGEVIPAPPVSAEALARLQESIHYQTVSFSDLSQLDTSQFNGFHRFLKKSFPLIHEKLTLKVIAKHSLLYQWTGTDASLNPFVIMAHQDVVPIEEATRAMWTVDPFAGTMKDGFIWGRGTTDDKINLMGIMETVEKLLSENFQPARTIYLAFGHDEEQGAVGARMMAEHLVKEGVTADMVLDEGGIITRDKVPGMTRPVALIGTSEKGYLTLKLTVEKSGGHSSMPDKETALGILSKALVAIHEHPFPPDFSPSTESFLEHVGPEMPFLQKIVFANRWLFKKVIIGIYENTPGGNAIVRTTSVPTIINSGVKDNVVPTSATAFVNFRTLPGDESQSVIARVNGIVGDERVKVTPELTYVSEASGESPIDGPAYHLVDETIHKVFDDVVTTPFMMIGVTDSRVMSGVSKNIYKFSPMIDPIGFHGIDERVSVDSYKTTLWFFETLLRNAQ